MMQRVPGPEGGEHAVTSGAPGKVAGAPAERTPSTRAERGLRPGPKGDTEGAEPGPRKGAARGTEQLGDQDSGAGRLCCRVVKLLLLSSSQFEIFLKP